MGTPSGQLPAPPTPEQEYAAAGLSPEQIAAFQAVGQAQTPAAYMAAAQAAGLTAGAQQAAAAQQFAGVAPGPVAAPSFDEQLAAANQRNAALQAQINTMQAQFQQAIAGLQSQMSGVQAAMPVKVDPVTESAAKVAQAFGSLIPHDAKNILASALHSHLVNLGLTDLAKLIV
jgi:hypothetical protein